MNTPRFYFDIYNRFINIKNVNSLSFLEINSDGSLSTNMWEQLFDNIRIETPSSITNNLFDFCYFNLVDYSNILSIIENFNLKKTNHGIHYFIFSNKLEFNNLFKILKDDMRYQNDGRNFHLIADLGFTPYFLKKSDGSLIKEQNESEGILVEYR